MKAHKIIWYIFLLAVAAEWLARLYNLTALEQISKPLLMPLLAAWFYFITPQGQIKAFWLIVALMFAWLGDMFLLLDEGANHYFILGLVMFLITHLVYIYLFYSTSHQFRPGFITWATGFSLVMFAFLLNFLLWPGLGSLRVPVMIYSLVLVGMGLTALFRKAVGNNAVLIGAILFIASDSLLAVNKFYEPFALAGFWVMVTYVLGQFLIVFGLARYLNAASAAEK